MKSLFVLALSLALVGSAAAAPGQATIGARDLHAVTKQNESFPSALVYGANGCLVGYFERAAYSRISGTCAPGATTIKQLPGAPANVRGKAGTILLLLLPESMGCAPCKPSLSRPQLEKALGKRAADFAIVETQVSLKGMLRR